MHSEAFAGLLRLYAEVDDDLAGRGAVCGGCGVCCHFEEVDHILYASGLEREYLLTVPFPPAPDAGPALLAAGLRCPYQSENHCHARGNRPLGCRLHFCRRPESASAPGEDDCEAWHTSLKRLHREAGLDWRYAPLLPLREH